MQAMQVDEALECADEWIKGVTQYEGAKGWRIACATLAAEVRRLRELQKPVAYRLKDEEASEYYGRDVWVYWSENEFREHPDTGKLVGMLEPLILGPNADVTGGPLAARPVDCRVRGEKSALAGRQTKGKK